MKRILISITVFIVAGLVIWLWFIMPEQGYVICESGTDCKLVAQGWAVIWHTWPIAILSVVIALIFISLLYEFFYEQAEKVDWMSRVAAAEKQAGIAEEEARTRYSEAISKAERREEVAYEKHIKAENRLIEANQKILEVKEYHENSKHRAGMAMSKAERIKRKYLKLIEEITP